MCTTLHTATAVSKECLVKLESMPPSEWYFAFPAQCVLMIGQVQCLFHTSSSHRSFTPLVFTPLSFTPPLHTSPLHTSLHTSSSHDQVQWTSGVSGALEALHAGTDADALKTFNAMWIDAIDGMVRLVRTQLTPLQRKLLSAKLVIDVHARDTVTSMVDIGTSWLNDFEWQRQLRYYWDAEIDDCTVCQTNTSFRYGYEYLGNSMRLVITPLTDKCARRYEISGRSRVDLGRISGRSRADLGRISGRSRVDLVRISRGSHDGLVWRAGAT